MSRLVSSNTEHHVRTCRANSQETDSERRVNQQTGFFYETVAPLLCIGNTSFIAISTLTSEMNFYTVSLGN